MGPATESIGATRHIVERNAIADENFVAALDAPAQSPALEALRTSPFAPR
jgi:hypothetical protein